MEDHEYSGMAAERRGVEKAEQQQKKAEIERQGWWEKQKAAWAQRKAEQTQRKAEQAQRRAERRRDRLILEINKRAARVRRARCRSRLQAERVEKMAAKDLPYGGDIKALITRIIILSALPVAVVPIDYILMGEFVNELVVSRGFYHPAQITALQCLFAAGVLLLELVSVKYAWRAAGLPQQEAVENNGKK